MFANALSHAHYMVVSVNRGTQNTIILIMGTPKMVPLMFGNIHIFTDLQACNATR